jgi:hypothetical protein
MSISQMNITQKTVALVGIVGSMFIFLPMGVRTCEMSRHNDDNPVVYEERYLPSRPITYNVAFDINDGVMNNPPVTNTEFLGTIDGKAAVYNVSVYKNHPFSWYHNNDRYQHIDDYYPFIASCYLNYEGNRIVADYCGSNRVDYVKPLETTDSELFSRGELTTAGKINKYDHLLQRAREEIFLPPAQNEIEKYNKEIEELEQKNDQKMEDAKKKLKHRIEKYL